MKKLLSVVLTLCVLLSFTAIRPIASAKETETLPAAYDARAEGLVTNVKSQGLYGTCWLHAVCAVAETNMIKKGLADQSVDYSELQLAYFAFQETDDPLGNFEKEGVTLVGNAANYTFLSCGGDPGLAGYTLMRGIGLVNESDVPYSSADDVLRNGLDDSYAYSKTAARLTDFYFIPFSQPDRIKQAILDNGAVCTTLNDASQNQSFPSYNPETAAYYKTNPDIGGAHSVAIVGWDDDYSVENFLASNRPSKPGAWLIKDSVGTDWGLDGYWWASYEDIDFNLNTTKKVAVMTFDLPESVGRTYQYDGSSRNSQFGFQANKAYMANIFTASADENLDAVSFCMNMYANKSYELYIYKNPSPNMPNSGTLVHSSTGISPGGYITVPISPIIPLQQGDTFSVIVGYAGADENGLMWLDYDVAKNDGYFSYSSYSALGQSFYNSDMINLAWTDYTTNQAIVTRYGQANFRIKAHTHLTTAKTYPLTVNNGTDLTGTAPYAPEAVVSIEADSAPEGMRFKEWSITGGMIADKTNVCTTFTMPAAAATVTAVYEPLPSAPVCIQVAEHEISSGRSLFVLGGYAVGVKDGQLVTQKISEIAEITTLGEEYYWQFDMSGSGWTLQAANGQYLGRSNTAPILTDSASTWKYSNGRFYEQQTVRRWFWNTTTNYYLNCVGTISMGTGSANATAAFYNVLSAQTHDYKLVCVEATCLQEGYEVQRCDNCGAEQNHIILSKTDHQYGEDHRCIWCGTRDPDAPQESILVSAAVTVTRRSFFFYSRYNVSIKAEAQGGSIAKVEYSTNNGSTYRSGTTFSQTTMPGTVRLRITDSAGNVTNWIYDNSTGTTVLY